MYHIMKKRLFTLLVCIAALSGANAATMNSQSCFVNEADTAEYVPSTPVTPSTPDVPYEPLDTGEIAPPVQPGTPTVWVPVIREEDNVTEYPHNPAVDEMISSVTPAKQEFTLTLEGDYLRIKGTLEARGYDKHYIHCQIIGDSVHLQRFDMDPVSTDMLLHYVDIFIPGFTEDYYHVTLAEQNDVDIYKQSMVMKPLMVTRPNSLTALRQESALRCQTLGESILFTSPDAVKTEVYTLDAVKVGEAPFHNGQAVVTVNNAPAACLYIVTYPDGRRESGKVMVR